MHKGSRFSSTRLGILKWAKVFWQIGILANFIYQLTQNDVSLIIQKRTDLETMKDYQLFAKIPGGAQGSKAKGRPVSLGDSIINKDFFLTWKNIKVKA